MQVLVMKYFFSIQKDIKDINELLMVIFIRTTVCFILFQLMQFSVWNLLYSIPGLQDLVVSLFYVHTIYSFAFGCEFIHEIK